MFNKKKFLKKVNWLDYILQLIIVTAGILIAFILNSWNESIREKNLTKLYLQGLHEELILNESELKTKLSYHEKLLNQLESDPENVKLRLHPPQLVNAAWKMAENNVFRQRVKPELYKQIIEVYQLHENLEYHSRTASQSMSQINVMEPFFLHLNNSGNTNLEAFATLQKQSWIPIFEDWITYERIYLQKINALMPSIEKAK